MPDKLTLNKVSTGIYYLEIKEKDIRMLCGSPGNAIKHLKKNGFINKVNNEGNHNNSYETGPNAVLLSDIMIQNGDFSNLTEFPILHMLYVQGMLVPDHINNSGEKPFLIGTKEQLKAQLEYIKRGNYGLYNIEELISAGVPLNMADRIMKMKLYFAFGKIKESNELINPVPFRGRVAKLKEDVIIFRKSVNIFEISYDNESVEVDLNLYHNERYEPPYNLKPRIIERDYFSIINAGNGDGWNTEKPCTSSIIVFQGRVYLIDAGPDTSYVLEALGIDIGEVKGIFITHVHDDHFTGLTTLMRSNHRIKVFAPKDIILTVYKKLSALTNIKESDFFDYFNVNYLIYDKWQIVDGLDVYPSRSPHPIETAIYRFRTISNNGIQKIYAHNSDIASNIIMKKMVKSYEKDSSIGISKKFYNQINEKYKEYADLKKIDVGEGLIHGRTKDYSQNKDKSKLIILSHTDREFSKDELKIGVDQPFGHVNILIKSEQNYLRRLAYDYLKILFPRVNKYELEILLNCHIRKYEKEEQFINIGASDTNAFLLITGTIAVIKSNNDRKIIRAGSIVGEIAALNSTKRMASCMTITPCNILEIPSQVLKEFLSRNTLTEEFAIRNKEKRFFIQKTSVLDDGVSTLDQYTIAQSVIFESYKKNEVIVNQGEESKGLIFLRKGELNIYKDDTFIETITPYQVAGETSFLEQTESQFTLIAKTDLQIGRINDKYLLHIPIIKFRLREIEDKRREILKFNSKKIISSNL